MSGHIRRIGTITAQELIIQNSHHDRQRVIDVISSSTEIYAGYWDTTFVNAWGIIPDTMLSDQAYLWMFETPWIKVYPKTAAKLSKQIISALLERYPTLWGHTTRQSFRWLSWLGATFSTIDNGYVRFEIVRKDN